MKIALVQMGSVPGNFNDAVERMAERARQAQAQGAELAVYPATVLSGAYPQGLVEYRAYQLDLIEAVKRLSGLAPIPCVVPAFVMDSQGSYAELFLCEPGGVTPLRRREAFTSAVEYTSVAEAPAPLSIGGVDLLFVAGSPSGDCPGVACDAMFALSPMPFCRDDSSSLGVYGLGDSVMKSLVAESPCAMVFLQGVGAYDDVVLAGGSFATTSDGVIAASCPLFEESVAVFEVVSRDCDAWQPEELGTGDFVGSLAEEIPGLSDEEWCGFLYRALVASVRDYVRKSGFSDVVLGLSGGIDSSVVASLAVDALGAEHVRGVLMPGPFSSADSVNDALALASNLGIETRTVAIRDMFGTAVAGLEEAFGGALPGVARENLQARMRGTVLMTLSNAWGALVLNTGNKSEAGMGYSTLYGDTVGAYAPLADVYKGRVFELARWRNAHGPYPVVPENVLVKPPSAELSEGQTDESSFGASYEQVDRVLTMHVDRCLDAQDIVEAGVDPAVVNKVLGACAASEYKRRQEPFGPVVTMRSFSDRGWPVVNGWRDRVDASCSQGVSSLGCWCDMENDELADLDGRPDVDAALDAMIAADARHVHPVAAAADVAFGAMLSGRGTDMDDCFGMPMFSKN